MDYRHIINQHLAINNKISPSTIENAINHQDAIKVLQHFNHTNNTNFAVSLYLTAITFQFYRQLSEEDRIYLKANHSYDNVILRELNYPYPFLVRYLHAIVRRYYIDTNVEFREKFAVARLERLLQQIDQNIDNNTLAYNSLLGNMPHHSIYFTGPFQ